MCIVPEDVVSDLQQALSELYGDCWSEASENGRYADQFKGILAKAKDLASDIQSLCAGIREDMNERARAA